MTKPVKLGLFISLGVIAISGIIALILNLDKMLDVAGSTFKPHTKTYTYNGETYKYKSCINVLFVGVDKGGKVESSGYYLNDEQADFLCVLSVDIKNKTYEMLHINRDTMCNVIELSIRGTEAGTAYEQIALSHNYGDGLEMSAKNTVKTVKNFLKGTPIDYYFVMKMDAVPIATDSVGGVEITLNSEQDLSNIDETWVPNAKIKLDGSNVMKFVRARMTVEDGTNLKRMVRQRQFIEAFINKVSENDNFESDYLINCYNSVEDYILTDVGLKTLGLISDYLKGFEYKGIHYLEGTTQVNENTGYVEFVPDEEYLVKKVLEVFYVK